jgi:hypothetical protein
VNGARKAGEWKSLVNLFLTDGSLTFMAVFEIAISLPRSGF